MIEPQHLRKGNIVDAVNPNNPSHLPATIMVEIASLPAHRAEVYSLAQLPLRSVVQAVNYADLTGIKINRVVLEKWCGFEVEEMEDEDEEPRIFTPIAEEVCISYHAGKIWVEDIETPVQHLHELQNLHYAHTLTELPVNF